MKFMMRCFVVAGVIKNCIWRQFHGFQFNSAACVLLLALVAIARPAGGTNIARNGPVKLGVADPNCPISNLSGGINS
jgi:hypothetical protein